MDIRKCRQVARQGPPVTREAAGILIHVQTGNDGMMKRYNSQLPTLAFWEIILATKQKDR